MATFMKSDASSLLGSLVDKASADRPIEDAKLAADRAAALAAVNADFDRRTADLLAARDDEDARLSALTAMFATVQDGASVALPDPQTAAA